MYNKLTVRDKIRNQNRARAKRVLLNDYKVNKGCTDCGYKDNPAALVFDHKEGKRNTVASMMWNSWNYIWEEINKCDVVCANCHAIRTFTRKQAKVVQR